jgi:hypothetical protein
VPTEHGGTTRLLRFRRHLGRVQRAVEVIRGDLAIRWCPPTALFRRLAESSVLASSRQAQGRGGARTPGATNAVYGDAGAAVQSTRQAQGYRASVHTVAFHDAVTQADEPARVRRMLPAVPFDLRRTRSALLGAQE